MSDRSARVRSWRAALLCAFIGAVWLNQSVGGNDWEALKERVATSTATTFEALVYPFSFLYRRAKDEQIYFATAGAILGRARDPEVLDRGAVPESFHRAEAPADGHLHAPYTEVPFEYPPPALPFIVLPRLVASSFATYSRLFGALMTACLLGAIAIAVRVARTSDTKPDAATRWLFGGALLLAHGGIAIQRLDAVVALFLALAVDASVRRKPAMLGVWLGLAGATKFVPLLLLPVIVAADARFYKDPKRLMTAVATAAASFAVGLAPMLAGGAIRDVLQYHSQRGLHVESTLGVLYGLAHAVTGHPEAATLDFGSYNFHGAISDLLARACAPITLLAIAILSTLVFRVARGADDDDAIRVRRIVCASIAGCATLWLTGKVFSPQYMTWAIPLVLAVPGAFAIRATVLVGSALLVSQIYLRGYYDYVCDQRLLGVVSIVVRQALLIALLVLTSRVALRSESAPAS